MNGPPSDLFGTDVLAEARGILAEAVRDVQPDHIFAGFSGGHDSLCAAHLASQLPGFSGCVHINTGTGIPQTLEFVRETCARYGWPLKVYAPPEGDTYRDIVLEHGFPGPFAHRFCYTRLKQRALRVWKREHAGRILLVTGVRIYESARRRMGHVTPVQRDGRVWWVAPMVHWQSDDKARYMTQHSLPENEVVQIMHYSGECLCGAYARPGELNELRAFFPEVAARIEALQVEAQAAGKHCRWGEPPPDALPEEDPEQDVFSFCSSCPVRHTNAA